MKAAVCLVGLCLLAGTVSADFAWETGKQYRYNVQSRALVEITEIDSQQTGLELDYTLLLTPTRQNTVNVQTEQLKATQVNEKLSAGCKKGQTKHGQHQELPQNVHKHLSALMEIIFQEGVVEAIKVPRGTPVWAQNVKKSIASFFTIDSTGKSALIQGNLNRQTLSQNTQEANQESGFFYKSLEQTVYGECETYYTVSQNGPFDYPYKFQKQAQSSRASGFGSGLGSQSQESSCSDSSEESSGEQAWPKAFNQFCQQDDQVYEIIKTVNFTTCSQKPVLDYSTPAGLNYEAGDNAGGSLWARALVTRIFACGQSRQNFTVLKISQEERLNTGLLDTEKVSAVVQNNVTLIAIQKQGQQPQGVHKAKTINNLVYRYNQQAQEDLQGEYQQRPSNGESDSQSDESNSESSSSSASGHQQRQRPQQQQQQDGLQYRQVLVVNPGKEKQFCVSSSEVAICAEDYWPQGIAQKTFKFHCTKSLEEAQAATSEIELGHFVNWSSNEEKHIHVEVPIECFRV